MMLENGVVFSFGFASYLDGSRGLKVHFLNVLNDGWMQTNILKLWRVFENC